MLAAIALVGGLAYWDQVREQRSALDDLAREQARLARTISIDRIPADLEGARVFVGSQIRSAPLQAAIARHDTTLRIDRDAAAELGFPRRTAVAGLAYTPQGAIVVVASAERERDREQRARFRLVLAVALAGGLVFLFGGLALRLQRSELVLEHQRQRDERLERASKAAIMGTLAMGIAHEISTPLGIIVGRAEQLAPRTGQDERGARAVRAILEQCERISQVIRAFLGLVRGDNPEASKLLPKEVALGARTMVEHRFENAGVNLQVTAPDALPPLHGDARLLEHALINLLLNACDACPRGGTVSLTVQASTDEVAFVVEDDGAGISPEDLARVTEPFFTTKAGRGSGLGLAIASEIVKSHRGRLALEPRSPRGTRATIALPLARKEAHEAA